MSVTLQRQPPPLGTAVAGGFSVKFTNGSLFAFRQFFHTDTDDVTTLVAAFDAYKALAKVFYNSAWSIDMGNIYTTATIGGKKQLISLGQPPYTAQLGTSGTATAGVSGYIQRIFSMDPAEAGRFGNVKFVGMGGESVRAPYVVTDIAGGTADEQALVGFWSDPTQHVVAHNGEFFTSRARVLTVFKKRQRQKLIRP